MRDYGGVMTVASVVLVAIVPAAALGQRVSLAVAGCPIPMPLVVFVGMARKTSAKPSTYLYKSDWFNTLGLHYFVLLLWLIYVKEHFFGKQMNKMNKSVLLAFGLQKRQWKYQENRTRTNMLFVGRIFPTPHKKA